MRESVKVVCTACALFVARQASAQAIPVAPAPPETRAAAAGGSEASWDVLWPVRSCSAARDPHTTANFFALHETQVLSNLDIAVWRDQGSLRTELATDTGFCWFRLGLGITMAKASGSQADAVAPEQKEAVQRLIASGGNVVLGGAAPVLFYRLPTADRSSWLGLFLAPRVGTDTPVLSESSDFSANTDLGLEAHGVYTTDLKKFAFYGRARGSFLWTTRGYANQLGMISRDTWLAQGLVGVRVTDFLQLSVSFLLYAPKAIRERYPEALLTLTANAPGAGGAAKATR